MRIALALVPALVVLAACSSDSATLEADPASWTPSSAQLTSVACGDLLAEWGTGEQDAPVACWTFVESVGLGETAAALSEDLGDYLGASPTRGPGCTPPTGTDRLVSCQAQWADGDQHVMLVAGVTINGLVELVDSGGSLADGGPVLHEALVWELDGAPQSEDEFATQYGPVQR